MLLRKIKIQSQFTKQILTLMFGTGIAQVIPLAITPLLTRMYTPEDFGLLALFISISTIFGSIANGRYELAIMLPEDDKEAFNVAALGLFISAIVSLSLLIAIVIFSGKILEITDSSFELYIYFIPFMVFLISCLNILTNLNNRMQMYKNMSKSYVFKSLSMASFQIFSGVFNFGAFGLIFGNIIGNMVANIRMRKNIEINAVCKLLSNKTIKDVGKKYINFPKFSMFAILANTLSTNLSNIIISVVYSVSTLGYYSFVQRLLGMPSTLVGNAVGQVFYREAVSERRATGLAINSFDSAFRKLLFIGGGIFFILYFIIEDSFSLIFGEEWRIAGEYGKILIPFFFIRFVSGSLSNLNNAFEKQKIALLWQVLLLVISLSVLFFGKYFSWGFDKYLTVFSFAVSFHYLVLLLVLFLVSRGKL